MNISDGLFLILSLLRKKLFEYIYSLGKRSVIERKSLDAFLSTNSWSFAINATANKIVLFIRGKKFSIPIKQSGEKNCFIGNIQSTEIIVMNIKKQKRKRLIGNFFKRKYESIRHRALLK